MRWSALLAVIIVSACFLQSVRASWRTRETKAVRNLAKRLLTVRYPEFFLAVHPKLDSDSYEIFGHPDGRIGVIGSSGVTVATGLYRYLKKWCGCQVTWGARNLKLPTELPREGLPVREHARFRQRYYMNVCTASYSMVWWNWGRWERELDWAALHGFNLILAPVGQEYIMSKTLRAFNFSEVDIMNYFTGPAFLAWNRMGNLQGWGGSLSPLWLERQVNLQQKILKRMRNLGISPVVPGFAGHLPPAVTTLYPDANVTIPTKGWGHFKKPFCCVPFLEPTDPLFKDIQLKFLQEYEDIYGPNHYYSIDPYNELEPRSKSSNYLAATADAIYNSLTAFNPKAIWVLQGWMFHHSQDFWGLPQAEAFLTAVPEEGLLVLDLQAELSPQYTRLQSFFGRRFLWCMLQNYGGVLGLYGSMDSIVQGMAEVLQNSTVAGMGITPEGIMQNEVVFELVTDLAWTTEELPLSNWIRLYTIRRYGKKDLNVVEAWNYLERSVYQAGANYTNHGRYILTHRPSLKLRPFVWYNPEDVFSAWDLMVNASTDPNLAAMTSFRMDLVDVTRQSLQLIFNIFYFDMVEAFNNKSIESLQAAWNQTTQLLADFDINLASDKHFLLGRWLKAAKERSVPPAMTSLFELNARNQITQWGPSGEILDYANKQWAGLINDYYHQRWMLFFDTLKDCLKKRRPFVQSKFNALVHELVEQRFDIDTKHYSARPRGNSIFIAWRLHQTYRPETTRWRAPQT